MPKVKITNAFIKKVQLPVSKPKEDYFDTDLTGLMVEVRKSGNKTFYYRYSKDSKTILHKLGNTDTTTADEARRLALKMKKAIATDSLESMFTKKSKVPTLLSFYEEHYLPYIKQHNNSWIKNESTFRIYILPVFAKYYMNEITSHDISKAHFDILNKKKMSNGTSNKLIVFMKHIYNMAIGMKIDGIVDNPANSVKKSEEPHRERYITKVDAKRLIEAAKSSKNIHLKYIIPFLLLTGARRNEVLHAKWKDVDYKKAIWTIPITKNKKIRKIPISSDLKALLQTIPNTSEFIFPSPKGDKPLILNNRTWEKVRNKAGLKSLRLHDLRHSFASALVNNGRSIYEVQVLLGHSDTKMSQRYAHLSNKSLLDAVSSAGKLFG